MASFDIQWRSSTRKDLRRLPRDEVPRILAEVARLTVEPLPHGAQKLSGAEHTYRLRVGDYRVVYEFRRAAGIVEIQRVRHRKDVYR